MNERYIDLSGDGSCLIMVIIFSTMVVLLVVGFIQGLFGL